MLHDLLGCRNKVRVSFKANSLKDALNFGFSYLEHEDHVVHYIATNPTVMKKLFIEMPESVLNPDQEFIGELWTAKLLVSKRLKDDEIILSNQVFSAVIDLNLNNGDEYASV
jgi:hypothetical protein